jgi:hypothetical protein
MPRLSMRSQACRRNITRRGSIEDDTGVHYTGAARRADSQPQCVRRRDRFGGPANVVGARCRCRICGPTATRSEKSTLVATLSEEHLANSLQNGMGRLPSVPVIVRSARKQMRSMAHRRLVVRPCLRVEVKIDHLHGRSHLVHLCRRFVYATSLIECEKVTLQPLNADGVPLLDIGEDQDAANAAASELWVRYLAISAPQPIEKTDREFSPNRRPRQ